MVSSEQSVPKIRKITGYVLAAAAGALLSWVLLLVIAYISHAASGSSGDMARCIGLGRFGWIGPVLIVGIVGGLSFYLGRFGGALPEATDPDAVQIRCVACGHAISDAWKICPHCGSLAGRTRRPSYTDD